MKINDEVFGELEFDYSWSKVSKINFYNEEVEIVVIIEGDEDGEFEKEQYDAYESLIDNWINIQKTLLIPILDYYQKKREELGFDIELNENYPEIISIEELLNHIKLVGIKVPYGELYGGRSIGISFDCTWDPENGLGARLSDEKVIEVGYQDIAI
ncbi:DUF2004 domain-containing protein [Listeria sp. FSL L7-1582]|uniref:DUF6985 domain-containing protein n=1 Tax=Listeria portnoyi TaxID=2713504 RepID=UPI00164D6E46|nr:DUF2004 domain-containing protein [Listeria portnoyi]MBC6309882.1 DUF2004 domain-containing protein [Listeria portnoyi]